MKSHKYNAVKTVIDSHSFPSKKEARRYQDLTLMCKAGEITGFHMQPKFPIVVNGVKICEYRADFLYTDPKTHEVTIEDVKGFKTPLYKLKKKLVEAIYGIIVKEI